MPVRTLAALIPGLLAMVLAPPGVADEVHLKNGSRLIGTVVSANDSRIVFDTDFAGRINIDIDDVDTFFTEEKVTVMMQSGEIKRDQRVAARGENLVMVSEAQESTLFDVEDIKWVNPEPWKIGEGYKWTGKIGVAGEFERGNSDSDEVDADVDTTWRTLTDRYIVRGNAEQDRSNGSKTKDKWKLRGQYDRFFSEDIDNYWGGGLMFEYDNFADLDLRTTLGPHIGRQFFETSFLDLKGQIGVAWVDEQFDVAEDSDHFAATWAFRLESDILGFGTTLYVNNDGTVDVTSADKVIADTIVGIRMPVYWGFETALEAKYEYDGGAEGDIDDLDETYNFKIIYAW